MFKKCIHYSPELEAEILGACLLEQGAFPRIFGIVTPEIFYMQSHRQIYCYMMEMFENNIPINHLSSMDFIQREKRVSEISNVNIAAFLTRLSINVTSNANLEYYSIILKEMWIAREIIILTSSGVKDEDARQEINNLQKKLTELSSNNCASDWKDMTELMVDLYKHQDDITNSKGVGILTGIPTIDKLYGGLFPGNLIFIGARPSVGKSAFAGQIAINMAVKGYKVGFVSMEMSNNEIAARLAAIDTNIGFNEIYRGLYVDESQRKSFYKKVNS